MTVKVKVIHIDARNVATNWGIEDWGSAPIAGSFYSRKKGGGTAIYKAVIVEGPADDGVITVYLRDV